MDTYTPGAWIDNPNPTVLVQNSDFYLWCNASATTGCTSFTGATVLARSAGQPSCHMHKRRGVLGDRSRELEHIGKRVWTGRIVCLHRNEYLDRPVWRHGQHNRSTLHLPASVG